MNLLDLPSHVIEKILSHVEHPHNELALVCKDFHDAVCRINRYEVYIEFFDRLMHIDEDVYKMLLNTKRKISLIVIHSEEYFDIEKMMDLVAAIGKNIEEIRISIPYLSLPDWHKILLLVPNCTKFGIYNSEDEPNFLSDIPIISHKLESLDIQDRNYWPFLQSIMKSTTLKEFIFDAVNLNFQDLKTFFLHQKKIKNFEVYLKKVVNANINVFENSGLETMQIYYDASRHGNHVEDIFGLLNNQRNLRSLELRGDTNRSNAIYPLRSMINLEFVELWRSYKVQNMRELSLLNNIRTLHVMDCFFENSSNILSQLEFSSIAHLKILCNDNTPAASVPFDTMSLAFPNLQTFVLGGYYVFTSQLKSLTRKCLMKVPHLWPNLTTLKLVDIDEIYDYGSPVNIDCLLEDNRESSKLKTLHLKFPMKFKTVHMLKLTYDYPEITHFALDTFCHDNDLKNLMLKIIKIMITRWTKLKTLEIRLNSLVFDSSDFEWVINYGLHLEKISFGCDNIMSHEDLSKVLKPHFKSVECDYNSFKLVK